MLRYITTSRNAVANTSVPIPSYLHPSENKNGKCEGQTRTRVKFEVDGKSDGYLMSGGT